jgi:hypothetical protein
VPLRQRVAVEPPAADVRLPAAPGEPQPGPGGAGRRRHGDPTATPGSPTGCRPRGGPSGWCSGGSCCPRARSPRPRPRSSRWRRWPEPHPSVLSDVSRSIAAEV